MLEATWFSEAQPASGTAFSLKIKRKLHEEQSEFQFLEIYETESFGNLMVIDGCTMVSTRDNFLYHEMMSHPVLFTHPNPKRVWIIGGGDCGTLREVLKHPGIEQAVQIDIDERVTRLAEIYFPELCASNDDPRATLKFIDGIKWVKEAAPGSVDIIIVDSTDPVGPAEGLFCADFYQDCFRALSDEGIVVQQSESPLLHMNILKAMRDEMRAGGFQHMQTVFFPQCIYPSGWWSATMATKSPLTAFREQDAANKAFETLFYNADIHKASLAMPEFFRKAFA
ncbi:MAG: polyamine aminopropyltransferase [Methylomonas sp.]|nr:polyamine aminopropyltransferase [Methylomonas sp.]PPD21031.1 MAG: spermidine synthase [Methylomonas sp.]PPD27058.1 MAG: spermidine synthase [Methylomonas sp.]PPD38991.1 MAG: spermidine synthase [Methylomonas sp.]PPD40889.1 MAG: spermidine synthase [Methylomonas sp.]